MSILDILTPPDSPPDMPGIHRYAAEQMALARRQGDPRTTRKWRRVVVKALRALRFAARIAAGRVDADPHSPHSIFSGAPKKVREMLTPIAAPGANRRRTLLEERLRW